MKQAKTLTASYMSTPLAFVLKKNRVITSISNLKRI